MSPSNKGHSSHKQIKKTPRDKKLSRGVYPFKLPSHVEKFKTKTGEIRYLSKITNRRIAAKRIRHNRRHQAYLEFNPRIHRFKKLDMELDFYNQPDLSKDERQFMDRFGSTHEFLQAIKESNPKLLEEFAPHEVKPDYPSEVLESDNERTVPRRRKNKSTKTKAKARIRIRPRRQSHNKIRKRGVRSHRVKMARRARRKRI